MRLTVIIASFGRSEILGRMLQHLEHQTRKPDAVILSTPDASHLPAPLNVDLNISAVHGPKGLTAQRNKALEAAIDTSDVIIFFDDDFLPANDYLEVLENAYEANPEFAVIHGSVVADGANNVGYSFEDGFRMLETAAQKPNTKLEIKDHTGAYGCNMSFRSSIVGEIRFDERLVLYGWQEDIDFTNQLGQFGRIVSLSSLEGVHLGVKAGRVSGTRLGFSQVTNPIYLVRKGTMPVSFAASLVFRNVTANLVKSFWPEPWVDRRGRLRGNLIALTHLIRGKIEPEHAVNL